VHDDILTQVVRFVIIGMLAIIGYFLRGVLRTVVTMEKQVNVLEQKVAIILDRDRRKRLSDYDREYEDRT